LVRIFWLEEKPQETPFPEGVIVTAPTMRARPIPAPIMPQEVEIPTAGGKTKRPRIKKPRLLMIKLTDVYPIRMGGKSVPLQKMLIGEQEPLSLNGSHMLGSIDEDLKQRSARFKQAKLTLEAHMDSEQFKSTRKTELAKQIPLLEALPILTPVLTEPIKAEPVKMFKYERPPELSQLDKDKMKLGEDLKEEFAWDLVAREIALARNFILCHGGPCPRRVKTCWQHLLKTGTKSALEAERDGRRD
jgi:hypothetical protein